MKKEKPPITVRMSADGGLVPVTSYDAESLAECSGGQEFSLLPIKRRSPEHLKLYWSLLGKVIKATGRWPSTEHLHRDLKMSLGYCQPVVNQFGGVYYITDSISFSAMDQSDFNVFFELAMQKMSQDLGFDPLELLNV